MRERDHVPYMSAPDWVVEEMPPGYQNRMAEIERLSEELRTMDPFSRLLWEAGPSLVQSVREAFVALALDTDVVPDVDFDALVAKVDHSRRLLMCVSGSARPIQRKDPALAQAFRLLHETAGDGDRVVLIANTQPTLRPSDRAEVVDPDAMTLLVRMGVNVLSTPALFGLWKLSLQERGRAREYIQWLHAQDGGLFAPAIV